jgi:hypothetical protein
MKKEEEKGSNPAPTKPTSGGAPVEPRHEPMAKGATYLPRREGASEGATLDSLAQLREILFGGAQRDLERRLARIDAHLAARAHELEQESRRRTEVVEAHMRRETESLAGRIQHELAERGDTFRAITREHRESISALEQRVAAVEDSLSRAHRELRQQLLEQAKAFLDEIQRMRHEFTDTLERELGLAEGALSEEAGGGHEEERPTP